jgi:hypothetical protein
MIVYLQWFDSRCVIQLENLVPFRYKTPQNQACSQGIHSIFMYALSCACNISVYTLAAINNIVVVVFQSTYLSCVV